MKWGIAPAIGSILMIELQFPLLAPIRLLTDVHSNKTSRDSKCTLGANEPFLLLAVHRGEPSDYLNLLVACRNGIGWLRYACGSAVEKWISVVLEAHNAV